MKDLALPRELKLYSYGNEDMLSSLVDIYIAVRRLSSMVDIDYCFPRHGSPKKRSDLPDLRLIALLVVAVKLYYPFDSLDRHPRSELDLGVLNIDWDKWCKLQKEYDTKLISEGKIGRGNEMLVNEQDVMSMSGEQLDEYLDWYEQMWTREDDGEHQKKGHIKHLLDMFPTNRANASSTPINDFTTEVKAEGHLLNEKLRKVQHGLQLRPTISKDGGGKSKEPLRRLGSFYKRYRKIEDLPPEAKIFHEAAATLVGVSLATLLSTVVQMERKLHVWRKKSLKERSGKSEDIESDSEKDSVINGTQASSMELDQKSDISVSDS